MAENGTKRRRKRILECPILTAASIPRPPRVECCVFGCRSSDRDPVSFHPLPQEPHRWSQWLKLINRKDLADKLCSGHCSAQICSAHFLPDQMAGGVLTSTALPTLLLPRTSHEFVYDGSSGLLSVQVKTEVHEDTIEIKIEEELPPTFHKESTEQQNLAAILSKSLEESPLAEPAQFPQRTDPQGLDAIQLKSLQEFQLAEPARFHQSTDPKHLNRSLDRYQLQARCPEIILSDPELSIAIGPIKPEPTYYDFQVNTEAQTDIVEAFYRIATFSAVEQINIPSKGTRFSDVSSRSAYTQTTRELVEVFGNDLRRKYGLEIEAAKKRLESIERPHVEKMQFLKGCDKYLDEKMAKFIKSHAYLSNKYVGKQLPAEFKDFALKLYLLNPRAYRFVEKFFDLPSKGCIERFRMPIRSGTNQNLMEAFKVKIEQMSASGKMCVVCFDVMSLKKNLYYDVGYDYLCGMQEIDDVFEQKPAEYAAVVAVRGVYSRWKQPVAYALVAEKRKHSELKAWLHKTIVDLFNIGLNVKALVTNFNDEFLDVSIKEPYFELNGRKIYHMYDVPDLFKTARDEFMRYDFHIGDSIPKWEHVVSVYDHDKERDLKLMPNMTEQHFRPDETVKNDIKLATQLFSSPVAAAMHFHIIAGIQDEQTTDTVQFIEKMSSIFDILYSRKLSDAYRATSSQQRFLKDAIQYLGTIKLKGSYGNVFQSKFVAGLTITIKSLMSLIAHLKKSNANYLLTKNLSKDFMLKHFEEVRRLANSKPTPIKFTRAFRRLYLSNLLNNTKTTATGDDILTTLSKIAEFVQYDMEKGETNQSANFSIDVTDYRINWPSNEYIAGYLLWKCLERHSCEELVKNLCDYYQFESQSRAELLETFQFYNAENINRLCKIRPPTQLRQFVDNMDNQFCERSSNVPKRSFGRSLYRIMESDTFQLPCACFPIMFLKMLYIRLKIFSTLTMFKQMI